MVGSRTRFDIILKRTLDGPCYINKRDIKDVLEGAVEGEARRGRKKVNNYTSGL